MSSEFQEPPPEVQHPASELWGPWVVSEPEGDRQNYRIVSGTQFKRPVEPISPAPGLNTQSESDSQGTFQDQVTAITPAFPAPEHNSVEGDIDPQAAFREHVTAVTPAFPASAPFPPLPSQQSGPISYSGYPAPFAGNPPSQNFPPPGVGYPPPGTSYPNFQVPSPSYQGYVSGPPAYPPYGAYPGYPYPYPYPYPPPAPKRDGYLLGVGITAFICSILVLLGGLFSLLVLVIVTSSNNTLSQDQRFESAVIFAAFTLIGTIGGSFGLYHSIRSVFLRKPSSGFAMPTFWLFVVLYAALIAGGFALHNQGQDLSNLFLLAVLVLLAGFLPAMAVLALGDRRLRFPKGGPWPTSWRRFTFAIVSGGTLGILVAGLLELVLSAVVVRGQGLNPLQCLNDPGSTGCQSPNIFTLLFLIVGIIGPLVEETVKPLAVIILIGRVRSAAEAFVLGLACGVGFDLIETSGYIGSSPADWLTIALERTGAGLLHGLGAAMVALGWYYLTHPGKNRALKVTGCWIYAFAQHAIWNSAPFLTVLPGSIGTFFSNQLLTIGTFTLSYFALVNIVEAVFMLLFLLYMTGRLRRNPASQEPLSQPA